MTNKLYEEIDQLREENKRLEADAAAYRRAAQLTVDALERTLEVEGRLHIEEKAALQMSKFALTQDAGRDLLDRMKRTEEALKLIKQKHIDIPNHNKYPSTVKICEEALSTP